MVLSPWIGTVGPSDWSFAGRKRPPQQSLLCKESHKLLRTHAIPDPKLHASGENLDYKSIASKIKLKPYDTVHKIYKTCSPVTGLL